MYLLSATGCLELPEHQLVCAGSCSPLSIMNFQRGDDIVGDHGLAVGPARVRIDPEAVGHLVGGDLPVGREAGM